MTDKITSVAGLRKAVEKIKHCLHRQEDKNDDPSWWIVDAEELEKLISEFEASVRERVKELESFKTEFRGWIKRTFGDEELRRILGGEG